MVVCGVVLLWGSGPRTAATAVAAPAPVSEAPTVAPASVSPAAAAPPSASSADYKTALGMWDGAMVAGDAGDAAHWLAAGMLMSRGQYPAAREQLQAVLATAPAGTPVALKAQMMLAGTAGGKKLIALAFDDFPFATGSPPMLDALGKAHVSATFFCIGHKMKDYPDLVARAVAEGHSLQNHTYDHLKLDEMTPDRIREEIDKCSQILRQYTGVTPRYLRGPHAATDATVDRVARECGLTCIDPVVTNIFDYGSTGAAVYERCMERAKPGAILSMHDGIPATIKVMPQVIAALRAKGYEFVTVDQLLGGGSTPASGASAAARAATPASALTSWSGATLAPSSTDPDAGR
jgi:peptidoglycan/xylan/chitin deacetylase (PgdA/CDA1 family)